MTIIGIIEHSKNKNKFNILYEEKKKKQTVNKKLSITNIYMSQILNF